MSVSFEDRIDRSRYSNHWRWLSIERLQIAKKGRRAVVCPFASNQFDGERVTTTNSSDPLNRWIRFRHYSCQALDEFLSSFPWQYLKLHSSHRRNGLV